MTSPPSLRLPAPAKLNLFLHITGRRADGYHLLESVFAPITLADTVTLTRRDDGVIRLVDGPKDLDPATELSCRAASALRQLTGTRFGVDVHIEKRIPQGAGLGGGSSDAATTLLGLNRLWGLGRKREELQTLGASLGADVPFFVFGLPALARGIGERLLSVSLPVADYVVAFPGAGLATVSVFADAGLKRDSAPNTDNVFATDYGRNDLQPVAERLRHGIAALGTAFTRAGATPRMTGSGACVFAPAPDGGAARSLAARLTAEGWRSWAVRSIARHPLFGFANGATI